MSLTVRKSKTKLSKKINSNYVCVEMNDGTHRRVYRDEADKLVGENKASFIPKHKFKGKVNGKSVDWSFKVGGEEGKKILAEKESQAKESIEIANNVKKTKQKKNANKKSKNSPS